MRYAIYFAPRESDALWRVGCQWLGRDSVNGAVLDQPVVPGMSAADVSELTASPRRYGFHATLKPPFRLVSGTTPNDFFDAVTAFANQRSQFQLPRLLVRRLASFLALQAAAPCQELHVLAADCVSEFDEFRAAESDEEQARRRAGVNERQRAHLVRWGYPYVMDQWRFHMTLTDKLPASRVLPLESFLTDWFAPALEESVWVQDLCVYVEPDPGRHFNLAARFPLGG